MPPTKKATAKATTPPPATTDPTPDPDATPIPDPTPDPEAVGYDADDTGTVSEGDPVVYAAHDDSNRFGLVVRVQSEERDDNDQVLREDGVYVVPLPEPVFVPTAQLRD